MDRRDVEPDPRSPALRPLGRGLALRARLEARNRSGRCNLGTKLAFKPGHRKDVELFLDESALAKPLGWRNSVEQVRAVLAAGKAIVDGPAASHSTTDRSPHA
jgi:hypothetical protein